MTDRRGRWTDVETDRGVDDVTLLILEWLVPTLAIGKAYRSEVQQRHGPSVPGS